MADAVEEKLQYIFGGATDKGGRQENQDHFWIEFRTIGEQQVLIAAVSDGVGSTKIGGLVSSMAVQCVHEWLNKQKNAFEKKELALKGLLSDIKELNTHIISKVREEKQSGATTLSLLLIIDRNFYIIHIGDSRIYICRNQSLIQETVDHNLDGRVPDNWMWKDHRKPSTILTRYIGSENDPEFYVFEGILEIDDLFLLCTDGCYNCGDKLGYFEKLKVNDLGCNEQAAKKARKIIELVKKSGEQDNISLVIVRVKGAEHDKVNSCRKRYNISHKILRLFYCKKIKGFSDFKLCGSGRDEKRHRNGKTPL